MVVAQALVGVRGEGGGGGGELGGSQQYVVVNWNVRGEISAHYMCTVAPVRVLQT